MRDLLYEIGTEEIPAGFIQPALQQMQELFSKKAAELHLGHGAIKVFGTPRRLCLLVHQLDERQADIREELLGPSAAAGIAADGGYTKAAQGFVRARNATVNDLQLVDTAKGKYLQLVREVKGRASVELLPDLLRQILLDLSFAKSMRWGSWQHSFARPIQWIVALFGEEVVSFTHEGIQSGRDTRGHRFLADGSLHLRQPADYLPLLEQHYVLADGQLRRQAVLQQLTEAVAASSLAGQGQVAVDEELVDVVTNLVEMPFGVCGQFDEKFLQVPAEVLITSMREHQKSFPVVDQHGVLLPAFVAVNNTRVLDPAITRRGHQRVLRARLEDALFFFNEDRQIPFEQYRERLSGIVFQAKLGTMLEKSERVMKLSGLLAEKLSPADGKDAIRAAYLCKADLMTSMVGEFPSLQGTMGAAYAVHSGENPAVALAIKEHYMPKRAGAELPGSMVGALVGLADRIDTIAGCFGIGQVPTGTADPFGLRRLALAVVNIIAARKFTVPLGEIIQKSLALYGGKVDGSAATVAGIVQFIQGRFANDLITKGYEAGIVDAVLSVGFDDIADALQRMESFAAIRQEAAFPVLAASFKRIRNISKDNQCTAIDPALFAGPAEESLYAAYQKVLQDMEAALAGGDYTEALRVMLRLKEPVDVFFDQVMVMAKEQDVRQNRLNLLSLTGELMLRVGDIARI